MKKETANLLSVVCLGIIVISSITLSNKEEQKVILSNKVLGQYRNFLLPQKASRDIGYIDITQDDAFGPTWQFTEDKACFKGKKKIRFDFNVRSFTPDSKLDLVFTAFSNDNNDRTNVLYKSFNFEDDNSSDENWSHQSFLCDLPDEIKENYDYSIYFWNHSLKNIQIDDFSYRLE